MWSKIKDFLNIKKHGAKRVAHISLLTSAILLGAVVLPQGEKKPPKIDSIFPQSASAETKVTLTGSGFTASTNNVLVRGSAILTNVTSPDGTTLALTLPSSLPCSVGQACPIKVSNENGVSNAIPFKIAPSSAIQRERISVTVLTPNGGEVCIQGEYCGVTWAAYQNGQLITHEVVGNKDVGLVEVKIALVKDTATNSTDPSGLIIGWIEAEPDRIAAIRDYAWYAATVTDANNQFTYNVAAGTYKVLIVGQDENGQYTLWNTNTNTPGNFDVSDNPFTMLSQRKLKVVSPNGGETLRHGETIAITFDAVRIDNNVVAVSVFKQGTEYRNITTLPADSGTYKVQWTIPQQQTPIIGQEGYYIFESGNDYTIRVYTVLPNSFSTFIYDSSDTPFSVVAP